MLAYYIRCHTKSEKKDAKAITIKNSRSATQGMCPTYRTKMFIMGRG